MKLLGVFHAYPPTHGAGAEWMAHTLLAAAAAAGHDVTVVLSRDDEVSERYELDGVKVEPYQDKATLLRWAPDTDVILTHLENTPRASIVGKLNAKPVVHLLHNTFDPTRHWIRSCEPTFLIFNSQWMRADYLDWLERNRVPIPPSIVCHPPVIAADYAITPGPKITMINMTENKGANTFYGLAHRHPDVQFLAVAGGYGEQIVEHLPNVEHQPNTADMRVEVYGKTRVLLMPSIYESWGRVGVEAACSGIPTIAHPTPGLKESLNGSGIFADRDDPAQWDAALTTLLDGRKWRKASRLASERATQLDPTPDLARFVASMEALATRRRTK
jgi:glycosyltransferase involved in cell wall biosynthesis